MARSTQVDNVKMEADANSRDAWPLMLCLRAAPFLCFAGWAWGHLYWEPAYSSLFWAESTFEWAQSLGYTWEQFAGTGAGDGLVPKIVFAIGCLHLFCAVLCLTVRKRSWLQMPLLLMGAGALFLPAWSSYVSSGYEMPSLIEHGGQFLCPVLLVFALLAGARSRWTISVAIVATMMTFGGHGCYAIGFWPPPPNFVGMTRVILEVEYDTAKTFLFVAGIADLAVCVGILLPLVRGVAAGYAVIWGLLTALARPVAGMSYDLNYWGADQFVHEAVLRAPHFLIPLYLLGVFWINRRSKRQQQD